MALDRARGMRCPMPKCHPDQPRYSCTSWDDRKLDTRSGYGTRQKHSAEQVVSLLRQIEVGLANGMTTVQACKEASIVEQTY